MDHRTERTGCGEPGAPARAELDVADLVLVDMLRSHARTEVHELAGRVGLPRERVRARLRQMERSGIIRGYHAHTRALAPTAATDDSVLAFVRFTGRERPTAADLGELDGIRQVHSLCSGWDYMVEAEGSCFAACGTGQGAELLGYPADIALLSVAHAHRGAAARTTAALPTVLPSA